jgi:hypothetical protein
VNALASGDWLTRARVRRVALLCLVASAATILWLFLGGEATLDALGRPIGSDFSNVWTAGRMALDGRAAEAWDWAAHHAVQQQAHGRPDVPFYGWHYPPPFLLIASALATLPYLPALIVWQLATLIPFLALARRLVPDRDVVLLAAAAPVTLICLTHGHNGFLTALLLAGGLMLLDRRPLLAGLCFGCLIYKPQLGLVLPPLLLIGGHWRAILGACLSAALLIGATLLIWGWPVWQAFVDSLPLTRSVVIEQGGAGWHKIMSPFAAVRLWGGSVAAAHAVQWSVALAAIGALAWLHRVRAPAGLRNAFVCAAALLATPYVLDYDQLLLLPALGWLWRTGRETRPLPWEATLIALAWAAPMAARQAALLGGVPLGLIGPALVALLVLRRARRLGEPAMPRYGAAISAS